ncbi:holo-ACP synthase [Paenibacillus sp. P96]|uniref:Holo-[acyl-carrier-protein] synthase n=1 Tax=Paenibacillus zeirhizosphaerae TaxID=2987519 RepID=A0ABT9FM13_9BACL|nr:holo-ACP synthase [Paenibacillus sp. P96]MDP4095615.1 holo-ACP synthase [Paenibacillus sp. P96]
MIYGIGHDVVEIGRINRIMEGSQREAFLQRILTSDELVLAEARSGRLSEFAAGRFAAKEAVSKAFGCGIGRIIGFQDMTILPLTGGRPDVQLTTAAWGRLALPDNAVYQIHLSITHQSELASAFAVVECITNK